MEKLVCIVQKENRKVEIKQQIDDVSFSVYLKEAEQLFKVCYYRPSYLDALNLALDFVLKRKIL